MIGQQPRAALSELLIRVMQLTTRNQIDQNGADDNRGSVHRNPELVQAERF